MSKQTRIFFCVCSFALFSCTTIAETKNAHLQDSVITLNKQLADLEIQHQIRDKYLDDKLSESIALNENLNHVISLHGVWFTVLAIFITALGILIPVVTYLFAILPTQKALEKLDERINRYFEQTKNNEVDQALEILDKGEAIERQFATKVLENNYYYPFTNSQLFKIWTLLEEQKIYPPYGSIHILTKKTNAYADKYFMRDNFNSRPPISDAIRYFLKGKMENYWRTLDKLILDCKGDNRQIVFNDTLSSFASLSKENFIVFANRKDLIDQLTERELSNLGSNWTQKIASWNVMGVENTYLIEKVKV